ncbi:MAG: MBL fold metallo-hydrolase [Proteobacteria bacterium]|nr:MBL fold metallo-hydrolase [Pseudomonadota bacterium]
MIHFFKNTNNTNMRIIAYGAVEGVTGSCFLLEHEECKILVDCGLFQGDFDSTDQEFPFNASKIDFVIITHAHLDHIGRIPLLIKRGFKGKIICTKATFELGRLMLIDAAKVMYEDYLVKSRKAERRGESVNPPLYTEDDIIESYDYFKTVEYKETMRLNKNITFTLKDAGHILGSSYIQFSIHEGGKEKKIIFSGDLGNRNKPIVRNPSPPDDGETVFIEATYGDREHKKFDESKRELKEAIDYAFKNNGNVIIPTFALERAQELLYLLREMYEEKLLPPCKVFLDSPLAISATELFKRHIEYFDKEACDMIKKGRDPFSFPYLIYTRSVEESKSINYYRGNSIIIAGSGMCNGGRILHHLKHNLWNPNNSIVFIGFQAKGTLGRKIVDGERFVNIYGEQIKVNARVFTINGFSSHADKLILKNWLSQIKSLKNIYLIHGEKDIMEKFSQYLKESFSEVNVCIPKFGEAIEI